jgi:glycosyltransferase involved in cell wall biosynthesis
VHTQHLAADLAFKLGSSAPPITVMEHGIEPLCASPVSARPRPGRPVRLLMFGTVMRYKGVDVLLDALEGTDLVFDLTIAGKCYDDGLRTDLRSRIRRHRHQASILWRDEYLPESEMETLFGESDMLVLPYRRIDQSGVLLQAYRHGLPVVASRVGAFEDYVGPERGEVCPPEDPLALRGAIERLSRRLHAIDRTALAAGSRRLHWDQVVLALRPVYAGAERPAVEASR